MKIVKINGVAPVVALTAVLAIGVFLGTQLPANSAASESRERLENRCEELFVNESGLTYGNSVNRSGEYPDLIRVEATNGRVGYAYATEIQGENVTFTSDELRAFNERGVFTLYVPVYEADGTTTIGEFPICVDADNGGLVTDDGRHLITTEETARLSNGRSIGMWVYTFECGEVYGVVTMNDNEFVTASVNGDFVTESGVILGTASASRGFVSVNVASE